MIPWSWWMILSFPVAIVVDVAFQLLWLPYLHFKGVLFHKDLLRAVRPSIVVLIIADLVATFFFQAFLLLTGASLLPTLRSYVVDEWLVWFIVGLPAAWIGGQVVPAKAVTRWLNDQVSSGNTASPDGNSTTIVVESPGTGRKAALNHISAKMTMYASSRRSAAWEVCQNQLNGQALLNPARTLGRLSDAVRDSKNGTQTERVRKALERAHSEMSTGHAFENEKGGMVVEVVEAMRSANMLDAAQTAVWTGNVRSTT